MEDLIEALEQVLSPVMGVVYGLFYLTFLAALFGFLWLAFCIVTHRRPTVTIPGTLFTVGWALMELGIVIPTTMPRSLKLNIPQEIIFHWYDPVRWVLIGFSAALIAKIGMRHVRPLPSPESSGEARAELTPPAEPRPD